MEIPNFQDMEDSIMLECVNPYDISPIQGIGEKRAVTPSPKVKEEVASSPTLLEMEEFADLAPYIAHSVQEMPANCIDELNTPIIEAKGPFDFMVNESITIQSSEAADAASDLPKFESDTISQQTSSLLGGDYSFKSINNDFSVHSNSNNNNMSVNNLIQGSEVQVSQPSTSINGLGDIFLINNNTTSNLIGSETPINNNYCNMQQENQQFSASNKYEDNHSIVSVINDIQYANNSSSVDDYEYANNTTTSSPHRHQQEHLGIVTPDDSNGSEMPQSTSTQMHNNNGLAKLRLDLGFAMINSINTPDVIDTVVSLEENHNFNILDFVNEKDITTVNFEDIVLRQPSTSTQADAISTTTDDTSTASTQIIVKPSSRRRKRSKRYEDEDEDYVPPTQAKRNSARQSTSSSKRSKKRSHSSDSEDDDEEDEVFMDSPPKRGRPRRSSSVASSSDHSDVSKYRELRDKNNEASRKSRLKRKIKEQTLEKECEELEEKNIKLSARVEHLEKMVENFRNNLFKIMLKK